MSRKMMKANMQVNPYTILLHTFLLISCGISGVSCLYGQETRTKKEKMSPRLIEGYIVSFSGDTTPGYIRPGNFFKDQRRIRFMDYYGVKAKYSADRISAFGYDDKHYISYPTPYFFSGLFSDSSMFILRLIDGPASLYRYYTRRSLFTLQKGPAYFDLIIKPGGKQYEVSYSFKWKRIAEAFRDFPELYQAIQNDIYKPEDTRKIVRQYNIWYFEKTGY